MQKPQEWARPMAYVLLLLFLCLWAVTADAQRATGASGKKVSLEVEEAEFLSTFKALLKKAGVRYRITPTAEAIAGGVHITLRIKDVPLEKAVRQLMMGRLHYTLALTIEKGIYVLKPSNYVSKSAPRNVTLSLKDATLEEALLKVFQRAGVSYAFTVDGITAQKVTLDLKDVPHQKAMAMVLEAARPQPEMTYYQAELSDNMDYDVYIAAVYPPMHRLPLSAANDDNLPKEINARKITVYLRDENLYYALDAVLHTAGTYYTLDPRLRDFTMAPLSRKNVPLGEVLNRLFAETAGMYRPRYENGVISIVPTR